MPIYDYTCKKCKEEFEYLIIRSDDTPECPKCNSKKLEKQISKGTSFVLKGKGWASDGYKSSKKKS